MCWYYLASFSFSVSGLEKNILGIKWKGKVYIVCTPIFLYLSLYLQV